jgi:large subunit ribosomal protein L25
VHLSDLVLPAGVTIVALTHGADHDLSVVSVKAPRGGSEGADA